MPSVRALQRRSVQKHRQMAERINLAVIALRGPAPVGKRTRRVRGHPQLQAALVGIQFGFHFPAFPASAILVVGQHPVHGVVSFAHLIDAAELALLFERRRPEPRQPSY